MPNDPFTIRIFVPNGDPEGVRHIHKMNWTGLGIVFPREKWAEARNHTAFSHAGIYILVGVSEADESLPCIYIGEGDAVKDRIESHVAKKDFWTWCVTFVSTNGGLNKAHIQWLEFALYKRACEINQCKIENGNIPQEPALTDGEKADTRAFLREMYQILPLVGLRAFEVPKAIAEPKNTVNASASGTGSPDSNERDTIIVPADVEGFKETFLGENCWYAIRISGGMLPKIRWIAGYQTKPISAITHIAPVNRIEPYGDGKKYKVIFSEPAKSIDHIVLGDAKGGVQGPRYTAYSQLLKAKSLTDLYPE